MHSAFSDLGFKIPIRNKVDEMLLDYLTIHKKLVHTRPRQILLSSELQEKLKTHERKKEVGVISNLLEKGANVNFFQSKRLFQTRFHDHLLYEWNVYHFHLSTERERKSNFVKQTDQLLFCYIDKDKAILLDIERHKEGGFGDEKWLEIIDRDFPEVLEPFIAHNISDISPDVSPVERQRLWNYGYTLGMTKVNNKIIHSPGLGRATSGHSILVVKTCNEILRWLHTLGEHFKLHLLDICTAFEVDPVMANFQLIFGNPTLMVVESNSKKIILTYPQIFNFTDKERIPVTNKSN